jgi:uncharacterized membrane-anchored protein YhcB (DUF1043 family)
MIETNEILIFLAIFLVGGIIGFVICRFTLGRKKEAAQQQELDSTKAELEHYKSQVNNHFTSSAELMEQVASSYQALYSHMAGQSQTLLGETDLSPFPLLKKPYENKEEEPTRANEAAQETDDKLVSEDSREIVSDTSETVLDSSETALNTSETVSDSSETVSDSNKTVLDTSETVSDSNKTVLDTSETASDSSETVPSKRPHSNN